MVFRKKRTRKTYRKKRAYKKRIYKKRAHKRYVKKVKPWRSRAEDQIQKVVHTVRRNLLTDTNSTGSGNLCNIIYWACATTSPGFIPQDLTNAINTFSIENVTAAEWNLYRGQYS